MKIILQWCGRYRDGGTDQYRDKNQNKYFLDGRIASKTKGQLFDKYPGDADAQILDLKNFELVK